MRPGQKLSVARVLGSVLILGVLVVSLSAVTVLSVGLLTVGGVKVPQVGVLQDMQRYFYLTSNRNIWQFDDECASADDVLVYVPKPGDCTFSNIEFDITLTFDRYRRLHTQTARSIGPGIAVLGDSHAMGWGVENDETFSAHLEQLTGRTVHNLGVSSYATEREMLRLVTSPFSDAVDTIVIQYCDNDLNANRSYPIDLELARKRFTIAKQRHQPFTLSRFAQSLIDGYPVLSKHVADKTMSIVTSVVPQSIVGPARSPGANHSRQPMDHAGSVMRVLDGYADYLSDKRVIVFYSNAHGSDGSMGDWAGTVERPGYTVEFVDMDLNGNDHYFEIDDHLNADGHRGVALQLYDIVRHQPEDSKKFLSAVR